MFDETSKTIAESIEAKKQKASEANEELLKKLRTAKSLTFSDSMFYYFMETDEDAPGKEIGLGFKIHIPIPYDHPSFQEVIENAIEICDLTNKDGFATPFKVLKPTPYAREHGYRINKQKSIVIYPMALVAELNSGLKTNFAETFRIARILGSHLTRVPNYDQLKVDSDVQLPSGVWVSFGGIHKYQDGEHQDQSFWKRIQILQMPENEKEMLLRFLSAHKITPPTNE